MVSRDIKGKKQIMISYEMEQNKTLASRTLNMRIPLQD